MTVIGTYSGDPSLSTKDEVRFLIGDTFAPFLLSDFEVNHLITRQTSAVLAAAVGCEALAGRFSNQVDKRNSRLSVSASQRSKQFRLRGKELRAQLRRDGLVEVFVGGLTFSGKEALDNDTDAVQPHNRVGQDDHPGIAENFIPQRLGRF